jgi:hypothetical protein
MYFEFGESRTGWRLREGRKKAESIERERERERERTSSESKYEKESVENE